MKLFWTECTGAPQNNAHSEKDVDSNFSISSVDEIKLSKRVPINKPLRDGALNVTLCITESNIMKFKKLSCLLLYIYIYIYFVAL